jgi:hypothetical protein
MRSYRLANPIGAKTDKTDAFIQYKALTQEINMIRIKATQTKSVNTTKIW